jgi:carboxyl-terminal processing protease
MLRKFLSAVALAGAILAVLTATPRSSAQGVPRPAASVAEVYDYLRRGQALEGERRWGEAVAYYEEALRQFPDDGSLKRRFDLARLHCDVARRYADRSFRQGLAQLSYASALDAYAEVLLKIQAHYVDNPRWQDSVSSGTSALGVALSEPAFLETNGRPAHAQALKAFRDELGQLIASRPIETRNDARDAVIAAATLGQQRLGIAPSATVMEYLCGAASCLDPYSTYLTPDQLAEVYSQIEGNFVGLGVELKAQDGGLLIVRVIPNSPAQRGGLHEGDRIVAIDGQATRDLSSDKAANLLQGEPGSAVELVLDRRGAAARKAVIRRERVEVPSVDDARILDSARGLAYMKLPCFQKTTCRDVEDALWSLQREGMKSLIVDLRGNPGGLLVAAVEVADLFIERGVIVSTHGRNAYEDFVYSARESGTWRVPLVVLIDQDSASAAEIFAGAIRDHGRGTIVGQRSFGKGSVQGIFPLSAGNAGLRLTTAKFYSPSGRPFSGVGVEPHVAVRQAAKPVAAADGSAQPTPAERDPVLAAAIQVAVHLVAQR